jgi:predicted acetyltransferase
MRSSRSDNRLAGTVAGRTLRSVDFTIRPATADDFPEMAGVDAVSFGEHYSEQDLADALTIVDPTRFLVATDGDRIIGLTGDYPFTMTVPGGTLAVPGVTWVSVEPTHRRRGVLTALMHRQLTEYQAAGLPAAILTASEGGIYGRFGYGAASQTAKTEVDRRRATLARPTDAGAVRRVSTDEARHLFPAIHERWREQIPGALDRTDAWWDFLFLDRESDRNGMSALFHLAHADGYVSYRVKRDWNDGDPAHLCWLTDYVVASPQAHAALWQVLLGLDLFGSIQTYRMSIDDPLRHLLTDARQVQVSASLDGLWVRPLDPAAMLAARRYDVEVDIVLEVIDPMFGDSRYRLQGGPDGATCARSDRTADLSLGVGVLGSTYLGGTRLQALARAGLATADDPAALARLDRALLSDRLPMYGTAF